MKSINHLSREEQQNFMQCPHCTEYVDMHHLRNAVDHIIGKCVQKKELEIMHAKINIARSFEEIIGETLVNLN